MNTNKVLPVLLLLFLIIGSLVVTGPADAQEPLVGEDDQYTKEMDMSERGRFNWTVYKNSSRDYTVVVEVTGFKNWEKSVTPNYFVLDEDKPYRIVSLNFEVPEYPEKEVKEATVKFTFRELNQTERYVVEKDVRVNIEGVEPEGRANKLLGGFDNILPPPLDNPIGAFIVNIGIWALIALIISWLISPVIHTLAKRTETKLDDLIVEMIRKPIMILVLLYGIIHSVIRLNIKVGIRASIFQIYSLIVVFIGIYVVYRIFDGVLEEISERKLGDTFAKVLKPVFEKIGAIVIIMGGLIIAMRVVGFNITALLAGAGVAGLIIAFAAQDTLSNFFSGIHLLLDRPFTLGDVILLESGEYCRVESVGMRSTKLYSIFDHELIVLPNNNIANQKIVNLVQPDTKMRVSIDVGVAYGSDLEKVNKILNEVVKNHDDIVDNDEFPTLVRFKEFAESSLNFTVRFWVDDYMKQWGVTSEVRDRINRRFKEEEITIPFPQRTVWLNESKKKEN
ncbi:MAG: mechanosensitive ion channel family protein [Thermoplasmata archaeon]